MSENLAPEIVNPKPKISLVESSYPHPCRGLVFIEALHPRWMSLCRHNKLQAKWTPCLQLSHARRSNDKPSSIKVWARSKQDKHGF